MSHLPSLLRRAASLALLPLLAVPPSFGWGRDGHLMINRLAAESLSADVPAFLRAPAAIEEIEYLGPEPDRWRSSAEPELNSAQAPDHFIDLEIADQIGPLPRKRYDYIAALYALVGAHPDQASQLRPEKVGFQPYITSEVYERLKAAMREYRTLSAHHENTRPVEQAIVFYAGWLGHYVADGSQPMHVTTNYDGWAAKDNPRGYTTTHGLHEKFESTFVSDNLKAADARPLMSAPHAVGDEFVDYMAYLRHSASLTEPLYALDKNHAFDGAGTPEGKQFTAERLAAGASMLRDLIESAWVESAKPVPEWHPAPKQAGVAPDKAKS